MVLLPVNEAHWAHAEQAHYMVSLRRSLGDHGRAGKEYLLGSTLETWSLASVRDLV